MSGKASSLGIYNLSRPNAGLYSPSHRILRVVAPFRTLHHVSYSFGNDMSDMMFYLVLLSLVGLVVISIRHSMESHNFRLLAVHLTLLCAFSFLIWLTYQRAGVLTVNGASKNNEMMAVLGLYGFMFLGMLAHSGYKRFVQPQAPRPAFDFVLMIAPVFASTFVFIPLLASLQNDAMNLEGMAATKMMLFFVAFENGFLWKEYFDSRRMEKAAASNL